MSVINLFNIWRPLGYTCSLSGNCKQYLLNTYKATACNGFTELPYKVSRPDVWSATKMESFFEGCSGLESVPDMNTHNTDDFFSMYCDLKKVKTIRVDVTKMYEASYMFGNCTSLIELDFMGSVPVPRTVEKMFGGCASLKKIPEIDTSHIYNMSTMFTGCSALERIDWELDMSSCTTCTDMFTNCGSLVDGGIKLKNVPKNLDLSTIGCPASKYTIINYQEG